MPGLGVTIRPTATASYREFAVLAKEIEDAGAAGVFVPEAIANDALLSCLAIARETRRIKIASWIANIYLREPALCAAGAAMVQEESAGRFILGLGVSHRPALGGLGIEMGNARDKLRGYTTTIRRLLAGEPLSPTFALRIRKPATPLPIYFAALAKETARLAGEIGDGVMLYLCSPERARESASAAREVAARHGRKPADVAVTVGMPVYLHDDRATALKAARTGLAFYASLPFYNRLLARSGFENEAGTVMAAAQKGDTAGARAAMTDQMIDSVALVGPAAHCLERLAAYRAAGAELPVIVPNSVGEDYAAGVRRTLKAFAKAI